MISNKITITKHEYRNIQRQLAKLMALEEYGVTYWEHYEYALKDWHKEEEINNLLYNTIDNINDFLTEADVDQPAGQGCGYSITFEEEEMESILKSFAEKYVKIKT